MGLLETTATAEGHVFFVSGARYLAPHSRPVVLFPQNRGGGYVLVSVFSLPADAKPKVTLAWVLKCLEEYRNSDDVFDDAFLQTVVFNGTAIGDVEYTDEAREYLRKLGSEETLFVSSPELLPGPYALVGEELRDVWKLVDDSNGTCMTTLEPQLDPSMAARSFQLRSTDNQFLSFALQSRIKAKAAFSSPLAGLRIIIKDNIHLNGIKTSLGNRAFYDTYPARSESAKCIQKLLKQGVVVAGKAKMSSFGNWEEPTEYIDYHAPWNPRADRYQSPGGSSSGSAAAVAAYEWLDIAIGTDTWGSVTRPALWCGCFGLRPSIGAVSAKGVEPYVQAWDIPGILARNLQTCKDFTKEWLTKDALESNHKPFSSILWPTDFWGIIEPGQVEIARAFAKTAESTLGVQCEDISFEQVWEKRPPAEAKWLSLLEFIKPGTYDAYHNCDDFRKKHWQQFKRAPYTTPPNQRLWSFGESLSLEDRDRGFKRIDIYKAWLQSTVLLKKHAHALVILPIESMAPRYRDEPPTFKRPPQDGINTLALAPVLKSPALAVPIAQIPYHSKVTDCDEMLPFAVALMTPPGTDLTLIDTALNILKSAGLPTCVKTGKEMFDGKEDRSMWTSSMSLDPGSSYSEGQYGCNF